MESVFNSINTVVEQTIKKVWVNIVVHGYPGAGKGTQAAKLAKKYNLVYISTGEMMRDEVKNKTEIGEKIKSFIEIGAIVPDEIAIRMIESKIKTNPDSNGFIFKGFPRTLVQAYILDGMLRKLNASVTHVINLEVSMLEAIKRLSARAKTSGARSYDMNIDVIVQRLEEFEVITSQVAGYYEKQQKYSSINGNGEIDEVYARLEPIVEKAIKQIR
jgi:adenylate kinase